jgi:NAD(P)H dehydrogenase (quinone)
VNVLSPVMTVLAHPSGQSLDHRLGGTVRSVLKQAGVRHFFHDLYAESFDPVLTQDEAIAGDPWTRGTSSEQVRQSSQSGPDPLVDRHRRELAEAKALVVIHPDWFGKPPAIFTGWLDRVLLQRPHGADPDQPAWQLRRVLVINSVEQRPDPAQVMADPLGLLWREQIGRFLGSPKFERLTFGPSATDDTDQLTTWTNATQRATGWVCGAAR